MTGIKLTNKLRSTDADTDEVGKEARAAARRLRELRGFEQALRDEAARAMEQRKQSA
jgi:hypothetical protein